MRKQLLRNSIFLAGYSAVPYASSTQASASSKTSANSIGLLLESTKESAQQVTITFIDG
ncbi:MAG TPA: hypothetical protein VK112_04990 [Fodinibius sp.]|nr:hypothetical protein [Fodinibius sp.]